MNRLVISISANSFRHCCFPCKCLMVLCFIHRLIEYITCVTNCPKWWSGKRYERYRKSQPVAKREWKGKQSSTNDAGSVRHYERKKLLHAMPHLILRLSSWTLNFVLGIRSIPTTWRGFTSPSVEALSYYRVGKTACLNNSDISKEI